MIALAGMAALGLGSPLPAEPPPPATVALALDTSGSVGPVQFARARDLALAILRALPAGSEVAVLAFDDQSRVVVPRTTSEEEVRRGIAALKVGGRFTALHDALYDAGRYVHDAPGERKAIVLITDGLDENSALNLEDGLRVATDSQIPVFAVGVGPHPQERVLRRIAKLSGGDYVAFDRARGGELAARIATIAPAPAAAAAAAAGPDRRVSAEPGSAARGNAGKAPVPAGAPRSADGRPGAARPALLVWIAALAVTVVGAIAVVVLTRRKPAPRPCPSCGRPLHTGASTCPACAEVPTRVPSRASRGTRPAAGPVLGASAASSAEPELSETVLARMNMTEEYLERTVTLQERPVLAVTRGPGVGQVFVLSPTSATSIGRSRANDIQVEDVSVSGQHCRVRPEEGRFVLHDLRSTNGTMVNDKKVGRHVLAEGDVIQIGETALQYRREMKRG